MITGGGSGMGLASALLFAKEGAKVAIVDLDPSRAEPVSNGSEMISIKADVTKSSQVKEAVESVIQRFRRLDVLFCSAGIVSYGNVVTLTEDEWDKVIDTNLKSMFLCAKHAIPYMVNQGGGSIVNMSSVSGFVTGPDEAAYDASKAGIIMLTKAIAVDFGNKGIRANCICPASTDTPFLRRYAELTPDPQKFLDETAKMNVAIGRLIKPEEVANLAVYLASDESRAVTGTSIIIDGGYTSI